MTTELADKLAAHLAEWDRYITILATRYARAFGREVEEMKGELFLLITKHYPKYDPARAAFSTWVTLLARKLAKRAGAIPAVREWVPGSRGQTIWLYNAAPMECPEPLDTSSREPVDGAAVQECRSAVAAAVAELSQDDQELVRAEFWGESTGPRRQAARDRVEGVLDRLRKRLAGLR